MDNNNWRPSGDQQRQQLYQSQRTLPEIPSYSTAQTESGNAVDWQEEVFQKIKTIQEAYLPDLAVIYQRAASRVQQMGSLPRQRRSEQFEKLKQFKAAVERMILFLSVSKRDVIPALRDKVAIYEKQTIDLVNMLRPRNPVQQGELPQQSSHVVFSSQGQQSQNQPSQQQLMMPLQSHHQQLQQPNLLQRLQSSGQFTGSLLPPQNVVDQQRQQLYQSQRTLPEIPSYSTAQTESGNAVDWQEEVFQKIKTIQEAYLPDLAVIYQRAASRVQQMGSLPRQRRSEQFEKLKQFKAAVERMILFLSVSKRDVIPALRDKVAIYEKQTIDLVNMLRPRNPVQQGELPQQSSHVVFSSQGQQSQNQPSQQQLMMPLQSHHQQLQQPNLLQRLQSSGQFTGSLLPPQNVVDQQRQTLPEIPSSLLNSMAQTESGNSVDWQEEVYQKIKTLRDTYLSDLKEVKQRVAAKLQQNSFPHQQRSLQFNRLKQLKTMLERMIQFLSVSKRNIKPALKDKVASYERQIKRFVNMHMPRKPVQQGQLPQPQMQPVKQQSSQNGNLAINRGDWRALHPPGSRQKNVNTLLETLKKHVPYSGEEGIEELMRIAVSFEELIFNTAKNQMDYFCKISLKMQSMKEES
ncbi:mediator of RNA polymerase II transcription subunit 15a [Brassica rapa]|uniref:mediator of RNA polymerase II transcription subunit 15a n=1 Tax=Brassica campestris TaxID=3711 RepID=UPI00142E75CF|nr:mediator of RNA polymerase II transcription subunit 15a [Brassica rapa]